MERGTMSRILRMAAIILMMCVSRGGLGTTFYVDGSVPQSGDGASWQTAMKSIQEAINAASSGDTVVVAECVYVENILFNGQNIILTSTDPSSSAIVSKTIIDGNRAGTVITFAGTEDATCVLSGFTIRNGQNANGAGIFGGIPDNFTHATITNNVITGNRATNAGAGVLYCNGTIRNNVVAGNVAFFGAGLCECDGVIENNTIVGNTADYDGGGLANCDGTILNCIIWQNVAGQGAQFHQCSEPTYSCIEDWEGWGEGNIADFPHLVDLRGGDYHLLSWSFCVDAGDPWSDYSSEPEPNGERIDMGAYGNTPEATSISPDADEDYLPDDWEMHFFGNLSPDAYDDPDGDGVVNLDEYLAGTDPTMAPPSAWYVDGSVPESGDGTSWETAFKTIQKGIAAASDGQKVLVAQGTYLENIRFGGKNIALTSTDPFDSDVVANTIIAGNKAGYLVTFVGGEDETCVLSGFTIRNGSGFDASGIEGNHTHATIENNVVSDNVRGLSRCDGIIRNNVIARNIVSNSGGGLLECGGTITGNIIEENKAGYSGGGLISCQGLIEKNRITRNSAGYTGGGLSDCNGTIRNNIISGNSARSTGGGLESCNGAIENNAIVGNMCPYYPGGLESCKGTIVNCIIWGNFSAEGAQMRDCSAPTYSCIEDWQEGGEGNISDLPYFVNLGAGDYHLRSWSPCIDAGDPWSDYSNEPDPNGERIDMGAYGNTPEATSASQDTDEDSLPDDWERYFFGDLSRGPDDDPDGDGITNLQEYQRGTNPARSGPWYVDASVTASGDGTSWQTAFKTVQEGIDASPDGQKVTVAQGTYLENINFKGKNITLTGTNPLDSEVIANTVIDGGGRSSTVVFSGTEGETCLLSGFTIRNGVGFYGGGIRGNRTHATISNNVITDNSGPIAGGAMSDCDGMIRNNVIARNSSRAGGAFYYCDGIIESNSIVGNSAIDEGGAICQCWAVVRNCIIWGNTANRNLQLDGWRDPTYSCIQDWQKGGAGNISTYPYFQDPESGDFHLRSWSPSIDMGDPSSPYSLEPMPNGGRIDLGAYGNTLEATSKSADTDSDGLPDDWEVFCFGDLSENGNGDPDNDGFTNQYEYRDGFNPAFADPLAKNLNKGILYRTIQDAIRDSEEGNEIVVYPGVYRENINFGGKSIILHSGLRPTASFAGLAVIEGNQNGPVVTFSGSERDACILSGFVIRGGTVGILGGTSDTPTHATIRNNIITSNSAEGLFHCHGAIENNTIVGNGGSGLRDCKGTIQNCIIWGNGGEELAECSVPDYSCVEGGIKGGQGNIAKDPQFVAEASGDFRLLPSSPCVDAGVNLPWAFFGNDIRGLHRTMYGGEALCVDMGAHEYYINLVEIAPDGGKATLTWSSWLSSSGTTYSIFYSSDLVTWHVATNNLPSAGVETTSWTDDGYLTGVAPSLAPLRFYRVLENQ